jgi:hypothetical protein
MAWCLIKNRDTFTFSTLKTEAAGCSEKLVPVNQRTCQKAVMLKVEVCVGSRTFAVWPYLLTYLLTELSPS